MEPMNRILAALMIPMLVAVPARALETVREQSERELNAAGIAAIAVENPRGRVQVSADQAGRIRVTALKIVRAHDVETAQKFARETKVSLSTQGGKCRIMVQYPQHQEVRVGLWQMMSGDFDFPGVEVRLTLTVPRALPVTLRSTSGDLFTEDIEGRQELDTTSGEIGVSAAGGVVRAGTTSGDIRVSARGAARLRSVSGSLTAEAIGGPLDAHTTSGQLVVLGAQDSLDLGTVSGDIRVERAPHGIVATTTSGSIETRAAAGVVMLSTSSGDVDVRLVPPLASAEVSSSSGDIAARLADGMGCEVELKTSNGTVDTSVPLEVRTVTRHRVSGRVRGGSTPVVLRSASGDIVLTGGGS
jgi:DUF4097 and DUF4098 domain-containing protein YvlB